MTLTQMLTKAVRLAPSGAAVALEPGCSAISTVALYAATSDSPCVPRLLKRCPAIACTHALPVYSEHLLGLLSAEHAPATGVG
jgi:hypothetical protein